MSLPPLLLVGAGGHLLSCIDVLEQEGRFSIAGIIGLPDEVGSKRFGYAVYGTDSDLEFLVRDIKHALVCIGQIRSPGLRIQSFTRLQALGFSLPAIVSPHAVVSKYAVVGEGSIVMHGAIINAGAVVGSNCILNSRCLVEHGATVGDNCHIATGAILNGNVTIGAGSFVGSGTVVKEGTRVAENSVIGMGKSVRADWTEAGQIASGKEQT